MSETHTLHTTSHHIPPCELEVRDRSCMLNHSFVGQPNVMPSVAEEQRTWSEDLPVVHLEALCHDCGEPMEMCCCISHQDLGFV